MSQAVTYPSRSAQVKARVSRLAMGLGPNGKLPPMRQLSRDLDVSMMTLDRAYLELENDGLLLRKHGSGVYVTPAASQAIVALVVDRDIAVGEVAVFTRLVLQSIDSMLDRESQQLRVYLDRSGSNGGVLTGKDLQREAEHGRVQGAIFIGIGAGPLADGLRAQHVPTISLCEVPAPPPSVRLDFDGLATEAVTWLSGQGCRRIALLTPYSDDGPGEAAFRAAAATAGLAPDDTMVAPIRNPDFKAQPPPNLENGLHAVGALFGDAQGMAPPDGLVCFDDVMMQGALAGLHRQGIQPGHDLKVVTHANRHSAVLTLYENEIVTYEYDPDDVARALLSQLDSGLDGSGAGSDVTTVKGRLVVK